MFILSKNTTPIIDFLTNNIPLTYVSLWTMGWMKQIYGYKFISYIGNELTQYFFHLYNNVSRNTYLQI